jgi:hypothetical protein
VSRFGDDGDGDLPAVFWQIDLHRALTSGRGQRILRDIKAGLLAMPERRLVESHIVQEGAWRDDDSREIEGVCAVGAYAAWLKVQAGATWANAFADLADRWGGEQDAHWNTVQLGRSLGLARTVAYELAYVNDEYFGGMAPEDRWHAVLDWVRAQLLPPGVMSVLNVRALMYSYGRGGASGNQWETANLALDLAVAASCEPYRQPSWLDVAQPARTEREA